MTVESTNQVSVIENWLAERFAEQLDRDVSNINLTETLTRYGLDSIDAVTMVGELEDSLDEELPATLFWDYPTIAKSAQYLVENFDVSSILNDEDSHEKEEVREEEPEPVAAGGKKGWKGLFG